MQGVFFRDSARQEAEAHGVAGSAANRRDGAVELVLEGEPDAVELLVAWARSGPREASVESVDLAEEPPRGASGFDVT